jgi:uncharacterized protein (TIGR02302 family)
MSIKMVSRRIRARFFSKAAPPGSFHLTFRKRRSPIRYVLLILLILGGLSGWSFWGGGLMASINPDLRLRFHLLKPTLDAWITPPEYTGEPPIMIATPAGARYGDKIVEVPAGSMITAHLAEVDGDAPVLLIGKDESTFSPDINGGFEIASLIRDGDTIVIRRGWQTIDTWHIKVLPETAPQVAFVEPPSITEHKAVQLSYKATDDYGVTSVVARISPDVAAPRADSVPVDITLATPGAKEIRRVNFEDLTAYPWAGNKVHIELIATDTAGHSAASAPFDITIPARAFLNPIARALIAERAKLLKAPDDETVRDEVANVMAGVAHVPAAYREDPVVLMTLRAGAVRLILSHEPDAAASVDAMLWDAAVRIEDGTIGVAERRLHEAQRELADALDRKASAGEVQGLIERLREALASYIAALSTRPAHAGTPENLSQANGVQTNTLAPADTDRMLMHIRDLSISGDSDAARDELLKLNQKLEGIRNQPPSFSEEMEQRARALNYPEGTRDSAEHTMPNF